MKKEYVLIASNGRVTINNRLHVLTKVSESLFFHSSGQSSGEKQNGRHKRATDYYHSPAFSRILSFFLFLNNGS